MILLEKFKDPAGVLKKLEENGKDSKKENKKGSEK